MKHHQIHVALTFKSQTHRKPKLINPIAGGTAQAFFPFLFLFVCLLVCTLVRTNNSL